MCCGCECVIICQYGAWRGVCVARHGMAVPDQDYKQYQANAIPSREGSPDVLLFNARLASSEEERAFGIALAVPEGLLDGGRIVFIMEEATI